MEKCLLTIARHTLRGFLKPYKEERAGFLFGSKTGKILLIRRSRFYRGGVRQRSWITFPSDSIAVRRARQLAKKLHLNFLGFYHSHPEIGGEKSWGPSDADRIWLRTDSTSRIFMVVGIYPNSYNTSPTIQANNDGTLTCFCRGFSFRFNVHCKKHHRRSRLRIFAAKKRK